MEKKIYRDEIYVGEVVKACQIRRWGENSQFFLTKPKQLMTSSYFSYRSILFTPNENGFANDLLYDSPNYPILNITDDAVCLSKENSIVIKDAYNLGSLLQYHHYDLTLVFHDIQEIRHIFFTGRFAKDHCELFGYKENMPENFVHFKNGVKITDPEELRKYIEIARMERLKGHRSFSGIYDSVLPSELFSILDDRGDKSLSEVLHDQYYGIDSNIDSFKPSKEEGPIRKLKKW